MRFDSVRRRTVSDPLIIQLGALLFQNLGHKRAWDISARMRELARLLIQLQHDGHAITLTDALNGINFDKVIAAVEAEGGSYTDDDGRRLFKTLAYVIKVAGSLLKCAQLKRGVALRKNDAVS